MSLSKSPDVLAVWLADATRTEAAELAEALFDFDEAAARDLSEALAIEHQSRDFDQLEMEVPGLDPHALPILDSFREVTR